MLGESQEAGFITLIFAWQREGGEGGEGGKRGKRGKPIL